jgi:hypothetical protein
MKAALSFYVASLGAAGPAGSGHPPITARFFCLNHAIKEYSEHARVGWHVHAGRGTAQHRDYRLFAF